MAEESWARTRRAYEQAAAWFVHTADAAVTRLDEPGLGEWTVRDLVGHTSRSFLTVEAYLDQPVPAVEVRSPVDYFRIVMGGIVDPAAIAQRGRDAGTALGPDVGTAVREIAERVLTRVEAAHQDDLVATPAGGMRLADYLPTRTFELTVHTCDLAVALGQEAEVPDLAAAASLDLLAALAARSGLAASLLLAGTGRRGLPAGFTVL